MAEIYLVLISNPNHKSRDFESNPDLKFQSPPETSIPNRRSQIEDPGSPHQAVTPFLLNQSISLFQASLACSLR
jgi:hypothetical protein